MNRIRLLLCLLAACSPAGVGDPHDASLPTATVATVPATEPSPAASTPDFLQLLGGPILGEPPEGKRVYVANEPLAGGTGIPTWARKIMVPERFERAWFVFVDDQPGANWEHAARYVFIDTANTNDFAIVQGRTPPDELSGMRLLHPRN
jgi:hypothetical protein